MVLCIQLSDSLFPQFKEPVPKDFCPENSGLKLTFEADSSSLLRIVTGKIRRLPRVVHVVDPLEATSKTKNKKRR
jgi:hypothetical protein